MFGKVPCSVCRELGLARQCFRATMVRLNCWIAFEFQEFAVKPPVSANFSQVGLTATSRPTCPHNQPFYQTMLCACPPAGNGGVLRRFRARACLWRSLFGRVWGHNRGPCSPGVDGRSIFGVVGSGAEFELSR
jgi:hypothetical protein